ncbi:MAG: hypothetical protein HY673_05155 [Chloroflexi bacterium]|nr:hypothetical protein [Chloroflexota bacterium]
MTVPMKVLDHETLVALNQSSIRAGRKQSLRAEQIPPDQGKRFLVNFHFDHEWAGGRDVRLSIILKPGAITAWLDLSQDEYDALPQVEMNELEWEAAVCVGVPPWRP